MRRTPTGQLIRRDATPEEVEDVMRRGREGITKSRAANMFKRWRVDEVLKPEHREEYETLMQTPGMTGDRLHAWLAEHGYDVCKSAVRAHRKAFCFQVRDVKNAARAARAFAAAARHHGPRVMAEASALRYEQLLMENLFSLKDETNDYTQNYTPQDWAALGRATATLLACRAKSDELRDQQARRAAEADKASAEANKPPETQAERDARSSAVADRVREMLGLPVWDDDEDWKYGVPDYEMETFLDHMTGERKDIRGRAISEGEYHARPPHRLKKPPPPEIIPPGITPLIPPIPHPLAKVQLSAIPPVDRPIAQAIYEANRDASAEREREERGDVSSSSDGVSGCRSDGVEEG